MCLKEMQQIPCRRAKCACSPKVLVYKHMPVVSSHYRLIISERKRFVCHNLLCVMYVLLLGVNVRVQVYDKAHC